ncbi:hypothetical protein KBY93_15185, partial [Synechococcus sp. J7-Johnson]|uniref:hypothetical protein n=1 Tax=Synechococcus sp. J7-Johnson TaxID=2823737 RepID=UPI0020CE3403
RLDLFHQYGQDFTQLEPVDGGVGEEESALSNKASSLDSRSASRLFSVSSCAISILSCFVRLSLSSPRLSLSSSCFLPSSSRFSLSSTLICASIVGCQFNFANQRRHGGNEDRNSDLLVDVEADPEEIDMVVRGKKRDQNNQGATDKGGIAGAIKERKRIGLRRGSRHCVLCHDRSDGDPKSIH